MPTTGLSVVVGVSGDAQFMRKLETLGKTWFEWKEALNDTGEHLRAYFSGQVFSSQGGVLGTPWAELSASTQAQKAKHYQQYDTVPLIRTGKMQDSFAYHATATKLEITNTADYFKYHQSSEARHKIPRRRMFGINNDVKEIIRKAFEKAALLKIAGL